VTGDASSPTRVGMVSSEALVSPSPAGGLTARASPFERNLPVVTFPVVTSVDQRARRAPRGPGRPTGGQVLADRAELLAAAERLIRAEGPDVSMEAIAAEASVTKPILYRGVGDRDALVAALAEIVVDRVNEAATAAVAAASDPRDGLRRLVGAFVTVVEANENLYLFVTAGGPNGDRLGQALRLADRSAAPLAEGLATLRAASGLDSSLALTWAYAVIGSLHFTTLWWLRDRTLEPTQLADHLTELLWSGLAGAVPPSPLRRQGPPTT
jgi:AcrR family transcriptional regulator